MAAKRLLIIYYTGKGSTGRMADEIGEGAEGVGVKVEIKRVEECELGDLAEADGIVVGSPHLIQQCSMASKEAYRPIYRAVQEGTLARRQGWRMLHICGNTQGRQRMHQDAGISLLLSSQNGYNSWNRKGIR